MNDVLNNNPRFDIRWKNRWESKRSRANIQNIDIDALADLKRQMKMLFELVCESKKKDRCRYFYSANSIIPLYLLKLNNEYESDSKFFVHYNYVEPFLDSDPFQNDISTRSVFLLSYPVKNCISTLFFELTVSSTVFNKFYVLLPYSQMLVGKLSKHFIPNLLVVIDFDSPCLKGGTGETVFIDVDDCKNKLKKAGWNIHIINNNNVETIVSTIRRADDQKSQSNSSIVLIKTGILQIVL
jgi:hypothetical protein